MHDVACEFACAVRMRSSNGRERPFDPAHLRTSARKFANIDFFVQILPLKDDELVMSEM